jgi:signal transduction histidine kinase
MLDAMADIVWTINPENDEFEKIIMRMRSFAYELLGARQIDFQFHVDPNIERIKLPMQARKNLYLIFKESLNNMVKYSKADQAMLSIESHHNHLSMLIRDNGKGFDAGKDYQGNGLRNMKKRAQEIGATLIIDTTPGNGTTIKIDLAA